MKILFFLQNAYYDDGRGHAPGCSLLEFLQQMEMRK